MLRRNAITSALWYWMAFPRGVMPERLREVHEESGTIMGARMKRY